MLRHRCFRSAGVIFFQFRKSRSESSGDVVVTMEQTEWMTTLTYLMSLKYTRVVPVPTGALRKRAYGIVTSKPFDIVIYLIIGLNVIEMCVWWYGISDEALRVKELFNMAVFACFAVSVPALPTSLPSFTPPSLPLPLYLPPLSLTHTHTHTHSPSLSLSIPHQLLPRLLFLPRCLSLDERKLSLIHISEPTRPY